MRADNRGLKFWEISCISLVRHTHSHTHIRAEWRAYRLPTQLLPAITLTQIFLRSYTHVVDRCLVRNAGQLAGLLNLFAEALTGQLAVREEATDVTVQDPVAAGASTDHVALVGRNVVLTAERAAGTLRRVPIQRHKDVRAFKLTASLVVVAEDALEVEGAGGSVKTGARCGRRCTGGCQTGGRAGGRYCRELKGGHILRRRR